MLPLIFAVLLGFIIIVYVILDGFDLGIGILFPFTANEK
ncbi:cytochrome d ubiquinol oxidase subunit II [Legionella waltersii]|nr:cytochrome d ubiquinol oxidase subunit II [Legionella waltersii]